MVRVRKHTRLPLVTYLRGGERVSILWSYVTYYLFSPCTRKRKPLRDLGLLLSLVNETRKVRVYGVMFPLYASYRNDTSKYVKAILRQGGAIWGHENTFPGKTSLSKEALEGHPGFTSPFGFKLEGPSPGGRAFVTSPYII